VKTVLKILRIYLVPQSPSPVFYAYMLMLSRKKPDLIVHTSILIEKNNQNIMHSTKKFLKQLLKESNYYTVLFACSWKV